MVVACLVLAAVSIAVGYCLADYQAGQDTAFWRSVATVEEPERCALCGYGDAMTYHAPALVNLSTGEVSEMRVYEPKVSGEVKELAPIQQTGTFRFIYCAGLTGRQDTCSHTFRVEILEELEPMNMEYFCHSCRSLLVMTDREGYVLADLFDLNDIQIYSIEDGSEYTTRDYMVSIYRDP